MLNLENYMNVHLDIKLFGKIISVKEPSILVYEQITEIEKGINTKNLIEKRLQVVHMLLNNNKQGIRVKEEQLKRLSLSALEKIIEEVSMMRIKADNDPN